jgi:hypothetical protein
MAHGGGGGVCGGDVRLADGDQEKMSIYASCRVDDTESARGGVSKYGGGEGKRDKGGYLVHYMLRWVTAQQTVVCMVDQNMVGDGSGKRHGWDVSLCSLLQISDW